MKREQLRQHILLMESLYKKINLAGKFGIDLLENKKIGIAHEIDMLNENVLSLLSEDKREWVLWFMYENDFGKRQFPVNGHPAHDGAVTNVEQILDICYWVEV